MFRRPKSGIFQVINSNLAQSDLWGIPLCSFQSFRRLEGNLWRFYPVGNGWVSENGLW